MPWWAWLLAGVVVGVALTALAAVLYVLSLNLGGR